MVCSSHIEVTEKDGVILSVKFTRGCDGNTKGVAALASGMELQKATGALRGIDCRGRGTSCPDQLAKVLDYIAGA
ncbi:MAG: TIGR03905 family TSCPD domain-containing protein [Clostridium sp.]|nr:TIGR03905 family TSCPD domain-containing protein [Bacteroides sp.]MCM1199394.1 TIGR03905 family TSCPD domain-containing protein [Clostridium sp.]